MLVYIPLTLGILCPMPRLASCEKSISRLVLQSVVIVVRSVTHRDKHWRKRLPRNECLQCYQTCSNERIPNKDGPERNAFGDKRVEGSYQVFRVGSGGHALPCLLLHISPQVSRCGNIVPSNSWVTVVIED